MPWRSVSAAPLGKVSEVTAGSLLMRSGIDGKNACINRLDRWNDPVAVAKAHAIAAQIWRDHQ